MTVETTIELNYGHGGRFVGSFSATSVCWQHRAPALLEDWRARLRGALADPAGFPPLSQMCIPDDRVVLALDRGTPEAAQVVAEVWSVLERVGVSPGHVTILQPASLESAPAVDPRASLAPEVARHITWKSHDPTNPTGLSYLAATTDGERIYLARELTDADVCLSIGTIGYDPVLGYRGTNSVFYPGLSSADAIRELHGMSSAELGPDDDRRSRQLVDEVGWLLGSQFTIQVLPGGSGGPAMVFAGANEVVLQQGRDWLRQHQLVEIPSRVPAVLVAVDADASGHGWRHVAAALDVAQRLVERGGTIVVLSELDQPLGPGLQLIKSSASAKHALKPLREALPPDFIPATQLAHAADWARVYLLSRMPAETVEELFLTPLETPQEAVRWLKGLDSFGVIAGAQHCIGRIHRGSR